MKAYIKYFFYFGIIVLFSCQEEQTKNQSKQAIPAIENVYNETYEVGNYEGIVEFRNLNAEERQYEELYSSEPEPWNTFPHNRYRYYIDSITADGKKEVIGKKESYSGFCRCNLSKNKDSILIFAPLSGLFETIEVVDLAIFKNSFKSYIHYYRQPPNFFDSSISNKYQSLMLYQSPKFLQNDTIEGLLKFTTQPNPDGSKTFTGGLYFTCVTKEEGYYTKLRNR